MPTATIIVALLLAIIGCAPTAPRPPSSSSQLTPISLPNSLTTLRQGRGYLGQVVMAQGQVGSPWTADVYEPEVGVRCYHYHQRGSGMWSCILYPRAD